MEFKMPLGHDPQKQELREANVKVPDDLTQDEFWSMVLLLGAQLFGEMKEVDTEGVNRHYRSRWNPIPSLQNHIDRHC